MEVHFIGHASFIVDTGSKKIICDPWLKGKVFNDSWSLVSPPISVDFSEIDYIWISHEHPDHFNFETINSIDPDQKKKIKVLFQYQPSTRMLEAFKKVGLSEVIELDLWEWHKIDDFEIMVGPEGSLDSFCAIRNKDTTILNLNDCTTSKAKLMRIHKTCGNVDLLFTQFSFANWVGNDSDETFGAQRKVDQYKQQVHLLQPRLVVPFASFVYFCRPDNFRMNSWVNSPRAISHLFSNSVVLYNGDKINLSEKTFHDNEKALEAYELDYSKIAQIPYPNSKTKEEIGIAAQKSLAFLKSGLPKFIRKKFSRVDFEVLDLGETFTFDPSNERYQWNIVEKSLCRFQTNAQPLWFLLNFPWGAGTFYVSGLYRDQNYSAGLPRVFKWLIYLSADIFDFSKPMRFFRYWISRRKDAIDLLKSKLQLV